VSYKFFAAKMPEGVLELHQLDEKIVLRGNVSAMNRTLKIE
tara:strand:- start:8 stop:130 length:123 start_codon:yes stop_codon:yes gene_type:complete